MLIDWLTLRCNISDVQETDLLKIIPYLAEMRITNILTGELITNKMVIDIDAIRSDFGGMVWSITSNGKDKYLNIGASPASLEHGSNLFGSSDYNHCKELLLKHAKSVLKGVLLFNDGWQPRRIDFTQNYFLQSHTQVKDALHILRASDGIRQKSTVKGDSVYWGESSHYRSGKAYDKYIQSIYLNKLSLKRNKPAIYTESQLSLMESILRLELKLGRQFFDEHLDESILTTEYLLKQHEEFFNKFIGNSEVTDMDTLFKRIQQTAPTKGRGVAAYNTYLRIQQLGFETAKETMPKATFQLHKKYLLEAGLCVSDLTTAKIIPLKKRKIMMEPVYDWVHLEALHRKAA